MILTPNVSSLAALGNETGFYPDGVESFALLGIDPAEGFDPTAPLPFAVGLQFVGDGLTQPDTLTYGPVSKPSTAILGSLAAIVFWRTRRPSRQ